MSTICAIATSKGGAIGIVRVSGPHAIRCADSIFSGKITLKKASPYSIHYGKIIDGNEILDEALVSVFNSPNSYTGEDSIEIACHGSDYILKRVLELLVANGCEMAAPGEFTMRAFTNGKMDLCQAEAVADLISAESAAAHHIAMNQLRGGVTNKLSVLRNQLLELSSLLELELDFSEEDVEFADRKKLQEIANEVRSEISLLISSFADGNAIKNGIPVAIIGAPNVGKSTLLNALLKDDRAIVSDIQGTTRDIIEDTIILDGILFRFIDTAGLRDTSDTVELMGIERSRNAINRAQIILLVTEPGVPYPEIDTRDNQTVIRILNKSEEFQAINGIGLDKLENQLISVAPKVSENTVLITNARHKHALELAIEDINRSILSLQSNVSGDLIAEDLRQCLSHLAEIVGEINSVDVLQNIFQNFCIGK